MELILWRHAEAEVGSDDINRSLTRRGQQQAASMARWLRDRLPKNFRLLTSEAKRAIQTASALSKSYETYADFNPGHTLPEILKEINKLGENETIILVGHQPWIGNLASTLLTGGAHWWAVKKGAVWWIQKRAHNEQIQIRLQVMITPSML